MNLPFLKYKVVYNNGEERVVTMPELMDIGSENVKEVHYLVASSNEIDLFSNDTIELDVSEFSKEALFFGSNLGKVMKERNLDIVEVELFEFEQATSQTINMRIRFKRDGEYVREYDYYDIEADSETDQVMVITETKETDMFLLYLLQKGAVLKEKINK